MNNIYSNSDNLSKTDLESSEDRNEALLTATAGVAGISGAGYLINKEEKARQLFSKLPGSNRYALKHSTAQEFANTAGISPINLRDYYSKSSFQGSINSLVASVEELSPMSILKTLQLSNLAEPLVKSSVDNGPIKIPSTAVLAYFDFYKKQLKKQGVELTAEMVNRGFVLEGGKLYQATASGLADKSKVLMNYARVATSSVVVGARRSPNRVLEKLANINGTKIQNEAHYIDPTVIVGGSSKTKFGLDWARAYIRQGMEIGYRTLDNPLEGIKDIIGGLGVDIDNNSLFNSPFYKKISKYANIKLGTNGDYNLSTRKSLLTMSKNVIGKVGLAYAGYQGVNQLLYNSTDESSIWHEGLLHGAASIYSSAHIGFSKIFSDRFQNYKEEQEKAAEGSTSLTTLLGVPLAGATAGASLSYYKRLVDSATDGIEHATLASETHRENKFVKNIFNKIGIKAETNLLPYKANALKGGMLGLAAVLPFIPGALIGKSSEELEKEYSGEKEVENRGNRWWLAGGSKYEGDSIKNYQAGFIARILNNTKDKALYNGDVNKKLDYDPIYSPLKYLRNPYKEEQDTQDSRPYPVWGMEVSYGHFIGKIFQGTVGEIIKPTILSPDFVKQQKEQGTVKVNTDSLSMSASIEGNYNQNAPNQTNQYKIQETVRPKDKQLIDSGMMLSTDNPSVNPISQPLKKAFAAVGDFVGLKGFVGNTALNSLGINLEETDRQLERSGSSETIARTIKDLNLGDILTLGEMQRKLIPTGASARQDTVNPLNNKIAPSWLPHDESKYYIDFSKGDYWKNVQNAESRLPGKGYEALHPELEGVDPENYSLVHKYKILSDVAKGSEEQIATKKKLLSLANQNQLSNKDRDMFFTTLQQEINKSKKREFSEYLSEEEKSKLSVTGKVLNSIWETVTHNVESPLESLTPFRPGAKFVHKRTAIEDYNKTMLQGPDTGIWTSPYEHFIRPSWNRFKQALSFDVVKPIEAEERDNVEEYFDKLSYLKARKNNDTHAALKTVIGSSYGGVRDGSGLNRFKSSLSNDQKLYVDSFAKETDSKKRKEILKMLPKDVGEVYTDIWNNLNVAEEAKKSGKNVSKALQEAYNKRTKEISDNQDESTSSLEKRLKVADKEAESFIEKRTGVPSSGWVGWDKRLSMQDIKLRTLTVGKEDIFKYGFWNQDRARNERIVALDSEREVTSKLSDIRKKIRDTNKQEEEMKKELFQKGVVAKSIHLSSASENNVRMSIDQK